jgi:pimeloyl-ACP methyl ester carboxylesterase|tara:strand:- start:100341 stop:101219 length:879 start_codon:yes stop_codon:yes gene_type:complete
MTIRNTTTQTVKPVLVFAHANGIPSGSYKKYLAEFSGQYMLAPIPVLGLGRWPVGDNWSGLVDELEAFIEPLAKPVLGMGHSMGAVVMFMLASRHPDWFSNVVMLDPPLVNGWARPLFVLAHLLGQTDRITPAGKSLSRRHHWPDPEAVQNYFNGRGMFRHFDPECLQDYINSAVIKGEDGWDLLIPPLLEVEKFRQTPRNLHRFKRLQVPSLLVNGSRTADGFIAGALRHVRQHGMTHAQAPGSHMFPLENPIDTAAVVSAWLMHKPESKSADAASAHSQDKTLQGDHHVA